MRKGVAHRLRQDPVSRKRVDPGDYRKLNPCIFSNQLPRALLVLIPSAAPLLTAVELHGDGCLAAKVEPCRGCRLDPGDEDFATSTRDEVCGFKGLVFRVRDRVSLDYRGCQWAP